MANTNAVHSTNEVVMIPEISIINIQCHKAAIDFILDGDLSLKSRFDFCELFSEQFGVTFTQADNFLENVIEEFKE